MISYATHSARLRARLGYPKPSTPNNLQVHDALLARVQTLCNIMHMTTEGWLLSQFQMDFDGTQESYPITVLNFEGPYIVHTDPADYLDSRRREVETVRLLDLDLIENEDVKLTPVTGTTEVDTVLGVAFYQEDGIGWRVRPVPFGAQGNYVVWYEPGLVTEGALAAFPQALQSFYLLLEAQAGLDLLYLCEWDSYAPGENAMAKRAQIQARLAAIENEQMRLFMRYVMEINQPQNTWMNPFESAPGYWAYRNSGTGSIE